MIGAHILLDDFEKSSSLINQVMVMEPEHLSELLFTSTKRELAKGEKTLVLHAPFTVNLAHSSETVLGQKSILTMMSQIKLATSLWSKNSKVIPIVFHVGKQLKMEKQVACLNFISNLENILKKSQGDSDKIKILLETPAGQGTEMYTDIKEFISVYEKLQHYTHFGLCLDTCHTWSAGNRFENLLTNEKLGQYVKLVHLNDSQTDFNSRVDRHANLGYGTIFKEKELLIKVVKWCVNKVIPMILETDSTLHESEISLVNEIMGIRTKLDKKISPNSDKINIKMLDSGAVEMQHSGAVEMLDKDDEYIIDDRKKEKDYKSILIKEFKLLAVGEQNAFKRKAFQTVLGVLNGIQTPVTNAEMLKNLKGIGKGSYERIVEIISKGGLNELDEKTIEYRAIEELTNITGIGPVKAKELFVKYGIKSVNELEKAVNENRVKLNKNQIMGLKYEKDIKLRIPRAEIEMYDKYFENIVSKIGIKHLIVGSYRRELPDSGDIDVLFLNSGKTESSILEIVISEMERDGMIDGILSRGPKKILFVAHINYNGNKISRRVDFLLTEPNNYATSSLYFTGCKQLNVIMRQRAINLGMKLNEYGLFDNLEKQIDTPTEESIFEILKINYLKPNERNEVTIDDLIKNGKFYIS